MNFSQRNRHRKVRWNRLCISGTIFA